MPRNKDVDLFKHIGLKIRNKRKELKITQERLAEMIDVDYVQIYHYETGRSKIPIDYLLKLSKFFNVSPEYFYGDFEEKNKSINKSSVVVNYPESPELEKRIVAIKEIYKSENEDLIIGVNNCVDSMSVILKKRQEQRRDKRTVEKTKVGRTGKK
jgi:transcriptional regulator with XRE-family HTH domain